MSVDPLTKSYPMLTSYQYASNNPIVFIDLDGLEGCPPPKPGCPGSKNGETFNTTSECLTYPPTDVVHSSGSKQSQTWHWHEDSKDWYNQEDFTIANLDTENGQVLPPTGKYNPLRRDWNGWDVDKNGYLTGDPKRMEIMLPIGAGPKVVQGTLVIARMGFATSNASKAWAIYHGIKDLGGKAYLYIGKAKNGISARYSVSNLNKFQIQAFDKLKNLPDNATALGVEQHILNLN